MSGQRISKTGCAIVMAIGVLLVGPLSGPVTAAPDREHFSDGLETQAVAQAVDMQQGPPRENQGSVGAESNHEGDVGVIPVEGYEATYNQGVAHYRSGQYTEARDFFTRSTGVSDRHLEAKARFNLANCDYAEAVALAEQDSQAAIEKLETAISHYRGALDANAGDADSRANAELARMLIERLREQQEQDQEQEDQEQQEQQEQEQQQQDQDQIKRTSSSRTSSSRTSSNRTRSKRARIKRVRSSNRTRSKRVRSKRVSSRTSSRRTRSKRVSSRTSSQEDQDQEDQEDQDQEDQDQEDQDQEGQDQEGQDQEGQDQEGQDQEGQEQEGQEQEGQEQEGQEQEGQDQEGQDQEGQEQEGQEQEGQEQEGQEQEGQDQEGQEQQNSASSAQASQEQGEEGVQDGQAPQFGHVSQGEEHTGPMTKEEAEKMLQAVRDRDLKRRYDKLRKTQRYYQRVDRDW